MTWIPQPVRKSVVDPDHRYCNHENCYRERLRGRRFCYDHELEAELLADAKAISAIQMTFDRPSDGRHTNIYFISIKDDPGIVKIGKALHVAKRLCSLQTGHFKELELIASIKAMHETEKRLHALLREEHVRGEWFRRTPRIDALINACKEDDWLLFQSVMNSLSDHPPTEHTTSDQTSG